MFKVKARLLPLNDKYYGTEIVIVDDYGFEYYVSLCNPGNWEPSDRELDGICTIEQWRNNDWLPNITDGWTGKKGIYAKEAVDLCDDHFESRNTYELARKLVELINKGEKHE